MKAAHNVLYAKKHTQTNTSYAAMDVRYAFKGRGVDLEVEGVRYNYRDASRAAYMLGPPPARSGDFELEGGVNVSL